MSNEDKLRQALERICGLHDSNGELWKALADAKALLMHLYPAEQPSFEYQWRVIPEFSNYEVSTTGEVRRATDGWKCRWLHIPKGTPIKGAVKKNGYIQYVLVRNDGQSKHMSGHRLVALTYLGKPPKDNYVVCHLNHNKLDNRVENLMWGSNSINQIQSRGNRGIDTPFVANENYERIVHA